jgi:site-specific recombinase XerD
MTRQHAWWLLRRAAAAAGVTVPGADGRPRPATGLDFRHGAAVHQLRAGVPLSEVQQQLGHARVDTTALYTRLTSRERRSYADRVEW